MLIKSAALHFCGPQPPKVARLSVGWLNIKTADRYDIPDKADLDVLRALYDAAAAGRLGANSGANCTIFEQNPNRYSARFAETQ
jgi:hypothetical protein